MWWWRGTVECVFSLPKHVRKLGKTQEDSYLDELQQEALWLFGTPWS